MNFATTFRIPMQPIGKGRGRIVKLGKHAGIKTPDKTRAWLTEFSMRAARYAPRVPLDCPVQVSIVAVFERPKRLRRKKDPDGRMWHDRRPDADNVAKAVLDAMSRWWADDSRVVHLDVVKLYTAKDEQPCVEVRVSTHLLPTRLYVLPQDEARGPQTAEDAPGLPEDSGGPLRRDNGALKPSGGNLTIWDGDGATHPGDRV